MKLHYRGMSYEYDPSQEAKQLFQCERVSKLMYRGVNYCLDRNARSPEVPLSLAANKLIYRGIAYFINKTTQTEVNLVSQPASTLQIETPIVGEVI